MLLSDREESYLYTLNQERDSMKRHLVKCTTQWRKSLTNTYRQENKLSQLVSVTASSQHEIQVLV